MNPENAPKTRQRTVLVAIIIIAVAVALIFLAVNSTSTPTPSTSTPSALQVASTTAIAAQSTTSLTQMNTTTIHYVTVGEKIGNLTTLQGYIVPCDSCNCNMLQTKSGQLISLYDAPLDLVNSDASRMVSVTGYWATAPYQMFGQCSNNGLSVTSWSYAN